MLEERRDKMSEKQISEMTITEAQSKLDEAQASWSRLWNKVGVRAEVLEDYMRLLKTHISSLGK
jgi:membrane-bound lytic murein transglycosylase B